MVIMHTQQTSLWMSPAFRWDGQDLTNPIDIRDWIYIMIHDYEIMFFFIYIYLYIMNLVCLVYEFVGFIYKTPTL